MHNQLPPILRAREIADLLGVSLTTFHNKRDRLGLPPPFAELRGQVWRRADILRWLGVRDAEGPDRQATAEQIAADRAELDRRLAATAEARRNPQ